MIRPARGGPPDMTPDQASKLTYGTPVSVALRGQPRPGYFAGHKGPGRIAVSLSEGHSESIDVGHVEIVPEPKAIRRR